MFYENAEHAFANALSQRAMQLPFVKRARVDLQTSLGGRKGAGGVDVAGAFAEDDNGILGWQLRAYAAEHSAKGLNTGIFYRRVVGESLAGVNVFADYEDGDDGDFWRWSIGGDVKSRLGELSANRYFAVTDAQTINDENVYTREGYDVDVAVRIPKLEWAKARVGYYEFKGEFGDEDENGFRAGLDLSPGKGLVLGVEYDDDDGKFGGNISYTHNFGETSQGAQRAAAFSPRAHFYDAVRRENTQRISRAEGGGGGGAVVVNAAIDVGVFGGDGFTALTITSGSFQLPATGAVTATTHATGNDGDVTMRQGWELVIGNNAEIAFRRGDAATIVASRGRGSFNRNGANITLMQIGNAVITLLGTRFDFDTSGNGNITLHEGGLAIAAGENINVEVLDAPGTFAQVGNMTVGCGGALTLSAGNVSGKCAIARGGINTAGGAFDGTVTAGTEDVAVGLFTLSSADGVMATTETPGFYVVTAGGFQLAIRQTTAAQPNPAPIIANMIISGENQTTRTVLFTVVVNPAAIGVGFAGDTKTFSQAGAGNVIVGTLTIGGGFGANNFAIAGQSPNGGFALQESSVLIITSGAPARTALVTVRGDDNNTNTTPADLPVTVTIFENLSFAPVNLLAEAQRGMVTAHIAKTLGTLGASGGFGNYAFAAVGDGATLVDMSVMVLSLTTGVTTTLHYTINDRNADNTDNTAPASLTEPLTFFVTVTALNPLVISANVDISYNWAGLGATRASLHQRLRLTLDMAMTAAPPPRMVTLTVNIGAKVGADNNIANNAVRVDIFEIAGNPANNPNTIPGVNVIPYTISVYESNVLTIRGGG